VDRGPPWLKHETAANSSCFSFNWKVEEEVPGADIAFQQHVSFFSKEGIMKMKGLGSNKWAGMTANITSFGKFWLIFGWLELNIWDGVEVWLLHCHITHFSNEDKMKGFRSNNVVLITHDCKQYQNLSPC
jgi:hypothetical protein